MKTNCLCPNSENKLNVIAVAPIAKSVYLEFLFSTELAVKINVVTPNEKSIV